MGEREKQIVMRPMDVVILLKKLTPNGRRMNGKQLADSLGISPAEVSISLVRCRASRLIDSDKANVNVLSLKEFLVYGIRYAFPAAPGALVRGIPTASSADPVNRSIANNGEVYVWKDPEGTVRGQAIIPLYPNAGTAARKDPDFHALLSIVDSFRVGKSRERKVAEEELNKYIDRYVGADQQ